MYLHYFERLQRFVFLYISSFAEVEEIVSDALLSIWDNRKKLPDISNPDAYIYTVARYKAISHLRSRQENKISMHEITVDLFAHTETTPEDDMISKEKTDQLNNAINSLPYKCKMAFKLVREDKMKYKEVAAILEISVKTVEAHITTATRKLREALNHD
nr:RNA polymerase sigma-70 factor [Bacteroides sp. 519]